MNIVKEAQKNVKGFSARRNARWGTKLGHITPPVSPNELVDAVMSCDNQKAEAILKNYGCVPVAGINKHIASSVSEFYSVDYSYMMGVKNNKMQYVLNTDDCRITTAAKLQNEIDRTVPRFSVVEAHKTYKFTICNADGGLCTNFHVPKKGHLCLLSSRMVLALAVYLVTGNSYSATAKNLVNALIASDYVDFALKARQEKVHQTAKKIRETAAVEAAKDLTPEISKPTAAAPEAPEKVEESTNEDLFKMAVEGLAKNDGASADSVKTLMALGTLMLTLSATYLKEFFISINEESLRRALSAAGIDVNK